MNRAGVWKKFRVVAGAVCVATTVAGMAQESAPVAIKVDHRGLIEIPGVLRMNSGHHWGAANLT